MSEGGNNGRQSAAPLLERELFNHCKSESLSVEGLREIIERHGLTLNDNHVSNNYVFFYSACRNERVTEEIIRCLVEYFPNAASTADERGRSPLHYACFNKSVTLNIIQLLVDAAASVSSVNPNGMMPLHCLCDNRKLDNAAAIKIMKVLIEKYPEAVRHADNNGLLPIHYASGWRSPEFCRVLIEAWPGSEQIAPTTNAEGILPLHFACANNSLATVEYLYNLYPDATATRGDYIIRAAIASTSRRNDPATTVKIVQFLLNCYPDQKLKYSQGKSLLQFACGREYNDSNSEAGIQIIKVLFDAQPEAIEDNGIVSNIRRYHQQVQAFINGELFYARQANDHRLVTTPDDNGQLPLHTALQNNVRLGSIKLLVKGNLSAIRNIDDSGALPLHIACEHHDSASVIQYLLSLARITRDATDSQGNTVLHYACRGAKYDAITLLLEKYDAVSVSKRNAHGKLPIDLLWESTAVEDCESADYVGSVFQLIRAYPEIVQQ